MDEVSSIMANLEPIHLARRAVDNGRPGVPLDVLLSTPAAPGPVYGDAAACHTACFDMVDGLAMGDMIVQQASELAEARQVIKTQAEALAQTPDNADPGDSGAWGRCRVEHIVEQGRNLAEARKTIRTQEQALRQVRADSREVATYAYASATECISLEEDPPSRSCVDLVALYNGTLQVARALQTAHQNLKPGAEKTALEDESEEALLRFSTVKVDARKESAYRTFCRCIATAVYGYVKGETSTVTVTAETYGSMVAQVEVAVARYNKLKQTFNEVKTKAAALQESHSKLTQEKQKLEQGAEHSQEAEVAVARYNKLKLAFNEVKARVSALQESHNTLTQEKQKLEEDAGHAQKAEVAVARRCKKLQLTSNEVFNELKAKFAVLEEAHSNQTQEKQELEQAAADEHAGLMNCLPLQAQEKRIWTPYRAKLRAPDFCCGPDPARIVSPTCSLGRPACCAQRTIPTCQEWRCC
jgi:hypothetical protein